MLNLIGGETIMQNFENIEELVAHMFDKLDGDDPVSVVADKDLAVSIMKEMLDYDGVILNFANVDTFDYDKEYIVSLYDDTDTDYWHVSIEQVYNCEKDKYLGTDGYVLFHEDVNSKALLDMKNNENIELSGYDWFVIGEEETDDIKNNDVSANKDVIKSDDKSISTTFKEVYKVNNKIVDKDTFEKQFMKFKDRYMDNIRDMLLKYADFMDEWNDILRLFY